MEEKEPEPMDVIRHFLEISPDKGISEEAALEMWESLSEDQKRQMLLLHKIMLRVERLAREEEGDGQEEGQHVG